MCSRSLSLKSSTTLEELKVLVSEDYGIDQAMVDAEISYSPSQLAPVIVSNDRQVKNLIGYLRNGAVIQLCVTFKSRAKDQRSGTKIDLNELPNDGEEKIQQSISVEAGSSKGCVLEGQLNDGLKSVSKDDKVVGEKKNNRVIDCFKKHQHFKSRSDMQKAFEMCAMKYNFDYRVKKSEPGLWSIRCVDNVCNWRVRAVGLKGSSYYCINKYVAEHTCAPSKKTKFSRVASAKTVGQLIMHKYEGVNEGPKPNDIINYMRTDHGAELSYSQAWESRECDVNNVRGILERSYSKIPIFSLSQMKPIQT